LTSRIQQYDERDCVFAREDLLSDTSEYEEYYRFHPELKETDDFIRSLPGLGNGLPRGDNEMFLATARLMHRIGALDVVDGLPAAEKIKLTPERATEKIKAFTRHLGADLVGINQLNPAFIYSHRGRIKYPEEPWGQKINLTHRYAISLGFGMDIDLLRTGPRHGEMIGTGIGYYRSAVISVVLAEYIRSLGYPARAHHFRNYQVLPVPIAVDAGLGELARSGFLLTKEYGNCLRLATVTTDLPLECDHPIDIGIQDFCEMCKLCAEACPSGAIPMGNKVEVRGVMKWQLDPIKCITYWNKVGTDCGMCIGSCPWTESDTWYHRVASDWATKSHLARVVLLWLYPIVYGKYRPRALPDWLDKRINND